MKSGFPGVTAVWSEFNNLERVAADYFSFDLPVNRALCIPLTLESLCDRDGTSHKCLCY